MEDIIKLIIASGFSIVSPLFGGWPALLQVLVVFIVIDYVTGLIAAAYRGKLCSRVGFKGIGKKIIILALVAVAQGIDIITGGNNYFRDAVIYFYIINEIISIIENAGRVGLPIPKILKGFVEALKNKRNKEE